jgi:hypothetical protein
MRKIGVIVGMFRMRGAPLPLKATEALEVERIVINDNYPTTAPRNSPDALELSFLIFRCAVRG